jgi:hypothetical protein
MVVPGNHRQTHAGAIAFTLVELLVASVIMSTALLGVGELFRHAMEVEGCATVAWQERSEADAVASHLSEALAETVNMPDVPTIVASSMSGTDGWMICQTGMERRRYRWRPSDTGADCVLEMQKVQFAGTRNISPEAAGQQEGPDQLWDRVASTVIASGFSELSIRFRSLEGRKTDWRSDWSGPVGGVVAMVRATVGRQTVARTVHPQAVGHLPDEGEG